MKDLLLFLGIWVVVYLAYKHLNVIETFDEEAPKIREIQMKLIQVDPRAANISIKASTQSFTEEKQRTYLCLKDKDGKYYGDNMLMYVALHELAHVISKQNDPGHTTTEFYENFHDLLDKAESLKIYDPKIPVNLNYCPKS